MATLSSTGIGSGLDVNTIVTQLVALERQPIDRLKTEADRLDARLSSYGRIQSALDSLRTAGRTLSASTTWQAATATSADTSAVTATAGSSSSPGSYSVQVSNLAASQLVATGAFASSSASVGTGTLHIQLGTWSDDLGSFTVKPGSSTIDIDIGPGEDTLTAVRDKINATTDAGVRATIVNDATGSRLVLQSTATGAQNGFQLSVTDDDADDTDASGLSRLAYDPLGGAAVATRSQAARNAVAFVNGLRIESATNTLTEVIDGVSFTLAKPTSGTVDVTVNRDTASMRTAITGFTSAYNDLVRLLRDQTRYDASSKVAGTLQGDRAAINILSQLRLAMAGSSSASATFARAADVGISPQADGTLQIRSSTLDSALGNLDQLKAFFATSTDSSATNGLADRLRRLADALLGSDGAVPSRQEGLRRHKSGNTSRQAELEDRVAAVEKRLRAQYQQLDRSMAGLTGLQNYVTQQVNRWNSG